MSSQSEDEGVGVHPLVSNLLGQTFVPRAGDVFRYDRDEMMRLRKVPLSVYRPDYLSIEFDGDDGMFSPFKWLEHRWDVEGIKNRIPSKKLQDALRAENDDKIGLSPQRRGFSGGCRAPPSEDKKEREGVNNTKDEGWSTVDRERERLGSSGSNKWRTGSVNGSSSDKYVAKSNDFKLPFQKSATAVGDRDKNGRTAAWKTVEGKERQSGSFSNAGKFLPARTYRSDDRVERLPEWADGPTTMDDMIELRGFEEPNKKKKVPKEKKEDKKIDTKPEQKPNSRPSSGNNVDIGGSVPLGNGDSESIPSTLPKTDAELAALLGLFDVPSEIQTVFEKTSESQASAPSGSRLSRFFNKGIPQQTSASSAKGDSATAGLLAGYHHIERERSNPFGESGSNPMLAKLMARTPSTGGQTPITFGQQNIHHQNNVSDNRSQPFVGMPMRLEDLEKDIGRGESRNTIANVMKGNPLQDPNQHAQLMNKLHRMAKQQQDGPSENTNNMTGGPQSGGFVQGMNQMSQMLPPGVSMPPGVPALADPIVYAHTQQAFAHQMQQAMSAAIANSGGNLPPPQIVERIRASVLRNVMAQTQQQVVMAAIAQQHGHVKPPSRNPASTQMIPASVQRQMNKTTSSSHSDERRGDREKDHEDPNETAIRNQAETLKKLHMQQQYNVLFSAMQSGLPMGAWRAPNSGPPPAGGAAQPTPQQMQMLALHQAAQAAQAQQMRALMQNKQMQMKMVMQQMQAHQAMQTSGSDRAPSGSTQPQFSSSAHPTGNGVGMQSELSQVGPIQTPLEKLLAAAGVPAAQFHGSQDSHLHRGHHGFSQSHSHQAPPPSVRPMSLEELERQLTEKSK